MKKQKGITLIALVITIIVMLILVGVTISVSLKGGLFSTAKEATDETQMAKEREELLIAALGTLNQNGKVDLGKLDSSLPEGFTGSNGQYTSKTGNVFTVTEDGTITLVGGSSEEEPEEPETPVTPTITLSTTQISKEITNGTPETVELTATLNNASGDLTWQISDASVAEISESGTTRTITLKKAGIATITVSYGEVSATCNITVTEKTVEMATVTITVESESNANYGFLSKSTDVITYEEITSSSAYTVDLPVGSSLYILGDYDEAYKNSFATFSYPMSHADFDNAISGHFYLSLQTFPLISMFNEWPYLRINGIERDGSGLNEIVITGDTTIYCFAD